MQINKFIKACFPFTFLLIVGISFTLIAQNKPKIDTLNALNKSNTIELKNANAVIDSIFPKPKYKLFKENAHASYYAEKFNGLKTANGEKFSNNKLTAAHKKLPFGTKLRVTNTKNNKTVFVIVNDRGPFIKGRELDLSKRAFMSIVDNKNSGVAIVRIEIIE